MKDCKYVLRSTSIFDIVKPVYKGHLREPENVVFMGSCPLYTG